MLVKGYYGKKPFILITIVNFTIFPLSHAFWMLAVAFVIRVLKEFGQYFSLISPQFFSIFFCNNHPVAEALAEATNPGNNLALK